MFFIHCGHNEPLILWLDASPYKSILNQTFYHKANCTNNIVPLWSYNTENPQCYIKCMKFIIKFTVYRVHSSMWVLDPSVLRKGKGFEEGKRQAPSLWRKCSSGHTALIVYMLLQRCATRQFSPIIFTTSHTKFCRCKDTIIKHADLAFLAISFTLCLGHYWRPTYE